MDEVTGGLSVCLIAKRGLGIIEIACDVLLCEYSAIYPAKGRSDPGVNLSSKKAIDQSHTYLGRAWGVEKR